LSARGPDRPMDTRTTVPDAAWRDDPLSRPFALRVRRDGRVQPGSPPGTFRVRLDLRGRAEAQHTRDANRGIGGPGR
jgi:hypothetical protein